MAAATSTNKDGEDISFPGKIGRRLTTALGFLIAGVLLVGGFSLYLANSISTDTDNIKTIAERIEHADHMHFFMHHLIAQLNRKIIFGNKNQADRLRLIVRRLEGHVRHYKDLEADPPLLKARPQYAELRTIEEKLALLVRLVEKVAGSIEGGTEPSQEDLVTIRSLDDRMREQFPKLNSLHQKDIARELRASQSKMRLIIGIYLVFLVVGILGLTGWSWAVSRTIVSPIRNLASAALEVARGDFSKRVPLTSKDEIGQLSHSFNFMAQKIRDHEEKLKGVAALQERERIAQELHDSLAQDLALIRLKIIEAERELSPNGAASRATEILREVRQVAGKGYDDVRQAIFGLRTMVSKGLGLAPTLTEYLHDFSEQRGVPVDLKIHGDAVPEFSPQAEVQLIRIIHEALTNVFKHSGATRGKVSFEREGKFCKVTVEDDGKGFVLEEVMGRGLHFGLKTMQERARAVNGELKVETEPGKGTRVIVYLPLEEEVYGKDPGHPSR